jgi:hypothetical protein
MQLEANLDPEVLCRLADLVHHPNDLVASISSGSCLFDGPLTGASTTSCSVASHVDGCPVNSAIARVRQFDPAPEGSGRVVPAAQSPSLRSGRSSFVSELPVYTKPNYAVRV